MAGLTRKKIKVRSKKGKTYMRSVMVKQQEPMTLGRFMKKHGAKWVGLNMAAGSGMGIGGVAAAHATKGGWGAPAGAAVGGIVTNVGALMFLKKRRDWHREVTRDMQAMGNRDPRAVTTLNGISRASQITGTVLGGVTAHGVHILWHR